MVSRISEFGKTLTFTARVESVDSSIVPTGFVIFRNGSEVLDIIQLDNYGVAVLKVKLSSGDNNITATYVGNNIFNSSTSQSIVQTVLPLHELTLTSLTITSSQNILPYGSSVTFTVHINTGGLSALPLGKVFFFANGEKVGESTIYSTTVTSPVIFLEGGIQSLTAYYAGDNNYAASTSAPSSVLVNPISTTVAMTSSSVSVSTTDTVTFTATVTASFGVPTGLVQFSDGYSIIGQVPLSSGVAVFPYTFSTPGSYSVSVTYLGNNNHLTSLSNTVVQTVAKLAGATTTSLITSSINPSIYDQSTILDAYVSSAFGVPDGVVSFFDGYTNIYSSALSNGFANFTYIPPTAGAHNLTVQYLGTDVFAGSTSPIVVQNVSKGNVTLSLAENTGVTTTTYGVNLSFTATLSYSIVGSVETGTISFYDGYSLLSTVAVSSNHSSYSTQFLSGGSHNISAIYSGDTNFNTATSNTLTQTVNPLSTSTSIVISSGTNPTVIGNSVIYRATVSSSFGIPDGYINFFDGYTIIGILSLNVDGQASLSTSFSSIGTHVITAQYLASTNYQTSTSSPINQVVDGYLASVSLTSSINPSVTDQSTTFTATVSGTGPTPTGNVTFTSNGTTISTVALAGTTATLNHSFTSGIFSIIATYNGDSHYSSASSTTLSQRVEKESTTTNVTENPSPGCSLQNTAYTITTVSNLPGSTTIPTGTITLSAQDAFGVTTTLGSGSLSSGSLVINSAALSSGSYTVVASYSGDSNYSSSSFSGSYTVSVPTSTITSVTDNAPGHNILPGGNITFTSTVTTSAGTPITTGTVTFTVSTSPSQVIGTASLNGSGHASVSVTGWAYGTGFFTITATYNPSGCYASSSGTDTITVG